jgi:regulator of sigma E protease
VLVLQIIGGLLILVALVALHEFGHAIAARRNGVVVEEFGIGFPPRAWAKKLKSGVVFSLNWLPIGGFVKLQGEHDAANKKGDYGAATLWQKTKILLAGVLINWLIAVVLLTILAWTGMPQVLANQFSIPSDTHTNYSPVQIVSVVKDYPAEKAGFEKGDQILKFAGQSVPTAQALIDQTKSHRGQTVDVEISRNNQTIDKKVTLKDAQTGSLFGANLGQRATMQATWSAPIVGVATTGQFTWATLQGLGQLVGNVASGVALQFNPSTRDQANANLKQASDSVAGPVGILGTIFPSAEQAGPTQLVLLTALISLTLAVMNVLPIPSLDGGRWFVTVLFRLLKKPLTKKREESIQATGFMVLMGLVVIITIADVVKLF